MSNERNGAKWKVKEIKIDNWNIDDREKALISNLERIRKSLGFKCSFNERDKKIIYNIGKKESIEIFPLSNRVITVINHPKQGYTRLIRENLEDYEILSILFNPRSHIKSKGLRNKKKIYV